MAKKKKRYRLKKSLKLRFKTALLRKRNILSLLSLILIIVFIIFLSMMNMLPTKYLVLGSFVLIVLDIVSIVFINLYQKIGLKIIGSIIMFILSVISIVGSYYILSTNNFLNNSFSKKVQYEKNTYYVVAKKENNLTQEDISGEISTYEGTMYLDKALKKLNKKYKVSAKSYNEVGAQFDNLLNNTDKFMLVEKTSYEIIFQISDTYKRENFKTLYEFNIYTKKKKSSSTNTDKFNIYIAGTDFSGLTDFNMIASINNKTHKVLLTSIPRDYYINIPGRNGEKDKLGFMGAYGSNASKEALAEVFGIDIDYTVTLNTDSLVEIVDYVGGIEFCSDKEFTTTHALVRNTYNDRGKKLTIIKGCQQLNGIEALTLARERNAFEGRDRVRQQNCQKILIAIIKKLISTDTMLHYNETLNTLSTLYDTDISKDVISNLSKDIVNNGNKWKFETQSVDGTDGHDKVHSSSMIDWVMYPDQKTIDTAKNKIKETLK